MIQSLKNKNGFTLIELLVVIFIIAFMATFGLPTLLEAIDNQKVKGAARDLFSIFQRAKFEAISRNSNVVISATPAAFTPGGMVGSYQVFVDDGAGGGTSTDFIRNGTEEILTTVSMPRKVSLISASFSGGTQSAGFYSRGLPINNRFGSIQLRNSIRWYKISLSFAGNVNIQISNDGASWL